MRYTGFPPFADENSKILILGSFPSVKSREEGFYYGNPRNRFWSAVAAYAEAAVPVGTDEKRSLLKRCGIALWDVVIECDIRGSMDKDITRPKIADVRKLLTEYPNIKTVVTNGATAYSLLKKHFPSLDGICVPLPSTSPANVRLDVRAWVYALQHLLA